MSLSICRSLFGSAALVAALWCALPAWASHPQVESGKEAFLHGEFRTALARLEDAARSPSTTEEDLVEIFWYRGASYHALGKSRDAARAFDELLKIRPLYMPNKLETPPDLRDAFKKRADLYQKKHGVEFGAPLVEGTALTVPLRGHPDEVVSAVLFARAPGEVTFRQFDLAVEADLVKGTLDQLPLWEGAHKSGGKIELVLEGRNGRGTPVARSGDARAPLVLDVDPAQVQAAIEALRPAVATVEPAKDGTPETGNGQGGTGTTTAAPKPPEEKSSPMPLVLGIAGGGLVAVSVLTLAIGVLGALGAAASWSAAAASYYMLVQPGMDRRDDERTQWQQVWLFGQVSGYGFLPVFGAGLFFTLLIGGAGIAVLVARAILS